MEPLSCRNCCHNPLQLGSVGVGFGFCTRHGVTLLAPHLTTCGQLLRKDLLADSARRVREAQRKVFGENDVWELSDPSRRAAEDGLIDNDMTMVPDQVVEEVVGYGLLDSKMASMAALRRISGVRAEVAMVSLGRAYFQNCIAHNGTWTAGVHLFYWTLLRLDEEPVLGASDLLGPLNLPLARIIELAKWQVIAFRLVLLSDVAQRAAVEGETSVGKLANLAREAVEKTHPGSTESLLRWLQRKSRHISEALPPQRYDALRRELHKERGSPEGNAQ